MSEEEKNPTKGKDEESKSIGNNIRVEYTLAFGEKKKGIEEYNEGRFLGAIQFYVSALTKFQSILKVLEEQQQQQQNEESESQEIDGVKKQIAQTCCNISLCFYQRKDYLESKKYIHESLKYDSNYPKAYYTLAKLYRCLNKLDEAIKNINTCLELNPESEEGLREKEKILLLYKKTKYDTDDDSDDDGEDDNHNDYRHGFNPTVNLHSIMQKWSLPSQEDLYEKQLKEAIEKSLADEEERKKKEEEEEKLNKEQEEMKKYFVTMLKEQEQKELELNTPITPADEPFQLELDLELDDDDDDDDGDDDDDDVENNGIDEEEEEEEDIDDDDNDGDEEVIDKEETNQ